MSLEYMTSLLEILGDFLGKCHIKYFVIYPSCKISRNFCNTKIKDRLELPIIFELCKQKFREIAQI